MAATLTMARPAWAQHAKHLLDRFAVIVFVEAIQHVERGDQIELRVCKRQVNDAGSHDARLSVVGRTPHAGPRIVEPKGSAELRQNGEVRASATPAVQQHRLADTGGRTSQQWPHKAAKPSKPEVAPFGLTGGFEQTFHTTPDQLSGRR